MKRKCLFLYNEYNLFEKLILTNNFPQKQVFASNSTMFRKKLVDDLKSIEVEISKLDAIIQTEVNKHKENRALKRLELDFKSHFHPAFNDLKQLHKMYSSCCTIFDSMYSIYLKKLNDSKSKEKLKNSFQTKIKQWEGNVLMNFMIEIYVKQVKKKISDLSNKNGVFFSTLNEAKKKGALESNLKAWQAAKNEAFETDLIILTAPKKQCITIFVEFSKDLKNTFGNELLTM